MKFVGLADAHHDPLGTKDHHDHHDDSEKEHPIIAEGTEIFREQYQKEGADDDAYDRACAAQDDDGEDHGRFQKGEARRVDKGGLCREEDADKARPGGAQGKGGQLYPGLV